MAKLKSLGLTVSQWFVTYYMFYRYVHDIDVDQNQGTSEENQTTIYKECMDLIKKPHEPPFKMGTISKLTRLLETYRIAARLVCSDKKDLNQTPRKRARETMSSPSKTSTTSSPRKSARITASPKKAAPKDDSDQDEDLTLSTSSDDDFHDEEPKPKRPKIM
ncbi:MAG: hypothetical protein M1338_00010 [Patescibacteria group bacterium]|nr:hypothetical protein [Patescibacteria group bacterium]